MLTTKLDAVNQMLSYTGGAAVDTLDTDNPEVYTAINILNEISRTVQNEGWDFNSERSYPFNPDAITKEIEVPDNLLYFRLDQLTQYNRYHLVVRGGKFYDKKGHTYQFEEDLNCDVVWYYDFDDLPQPFKEYVTARAGRNFATRIIGSEEQYKLITADEQMLRAACIEYDARTSQPNVFGTMSGDNPVYNYLPYNTLRR